MSTAAALSLSLTLNVFQAMTIAFTVGLLMMMLVMPSRIAAVRKFAARLMGEPL
jgi:uncharacterized integral membrane protein